MRSTIPVLAVSVLVALAGGCADRYEKDTRAHVELLRELNEVLATATDKASLEAAIPSLEDLNGRIRQQIESSKKFNGRDEERRRELLAKYGETMKQLRLIFGEHMNRIEEIDKDDKKLRDKRFKAMKDIPPGY